RDEREPRGDADRPDQLEALGPNRAHQPPPERPLHDQRQGRREPHGGAGASWQDEAKNQRRRGNRAHADQVAPSGGHRSPLSDLESSRIREYITPPNPSKGARMVKMPSVPAFRSSHCPKSTPTTTVAANWIPSPA